MADYLVKTLVADKTIRAYAVDATEIVRTAQRDHDTWSASSAALGRSLIGTLLIASAGLKGAETMTVKIQGDGPVGAIVCDGNAKGTVKGYLHNPHVHLPLNHKGKIDVRGAVGTQGMLTVTKDLGLKEPFTGQVALVSGELGEDFTYYLAASEQIPSAVGLSVFVNTDNSIEVAGGFLIQALPGATDETLNALEQTLGSMPLVSEQLRAGKTPEQILATIFPNEPVEEVERVPVFFKCDCSKQRFAKAIASLGKAEITQMIDEDHGAEAVCQFCGKKYEFTEDELSNMIK